MTEQGQRAAVHEGGVGELCNLGRARDVATQRWLGLHTQSITGVAHVMLD